MNRCEQLVADRLEGFLVALAAVGITPGPEKRIDFLRAITAALPPTPRDLYWVARVTLVTGPGQLDAFDRIFAAWFGSVASPTVPPHDPDSPGEDAAERPAGPAPAYVETEVAVREGAGTATSALELLADARFPPISRAEAELLAEIETAARRDVPRARGRRRLAGRRRGDELDLARTAREAARTAGEVTQLRWRRRPDRHRRVLLLIDISGSLRASSTDALRCAHAMLRAVPRSEAYTFGTRLTRVTEPLRGADCDVALARVAAGVEDVNGGTRIGAALHEFLADASRACAARDALVIVVSDGLERGDPGQMAHAVGRLAALAHRLVWWSPLARDPAYRPVTRGMAAIADRLDDLVGVDDLPSALAAVRRLAVVPGAPARTRAHRPQPQVAHR